MRRSTTSAFPRPAAPQRRARRLLAVLAAAALATAACDTGEGVDTGEGNGGGTEADGGGSGEGGTLVAAISAQPDQLDPHSTSAYPSFQVLENVYDTLVVPDPEDLTFQPSLATEWETSEDELTWTFTLRDDVVFHDGSTFDSADVVYSYNRIIDEELQNAFRFATVDEVVAVDETTVEIRLTDPTPNLLDNIGSFKGMAIVSDGAAEEFDLATETNGTGPFTVAAQNPGDIQLQAFEDYWGEGPFVDTVEFRFVTEPTAALTALSTGEVQWTDNVPPQQVTTLAEDENVVLETVPSVDYWYMAFNQTRPPFDDVAVRRAVAFALDREAVTQAARFDAATVNQTAIPEDSFWYNDYAPFETDPEQAQSLLQEAGVTDLSMGLMVTEEFPETVQAAQVIQSQLAEVGITVDIQNETFANWLARQGEGDFDAFMLGWLGNLDPFGFYHAQHICEGSSNFHGYCNPEVDELLNQGATETDEDARKEFYDQAAQLIVDDVSYLYFYNPDVVQAWSPDLEGYQIRADRAINFETVRVGS